MVANFKTYESQARLLAAVIAAHPELKLNYKAIAKHYGNSQTAVAIEHRFRPLRAAGEALRVMVQKKLDAELLENIFVKNVLEIAQHFGESTADGIQFQFRSVKANAEILKNAVKNQESPVDAFQKVIGGGKAVPPATPRKRPQAPKAAGTPSLKPPASNANGGGTGARVKSPRKRTPKNYKEEPDSEDDESSARDYSELDLSPTKQAKKIKTTPNRMTGRGNTGNSVPQYDPITIPDNNTSELTILTPTDSVDNDIMEIKAEPANRGMNGAAAYTAPTQRPTNGFNPSRTTSTSYYPIAQAQFGTFTGAGNFQATPPRHQTQSIFGGDAPHGHGTFEGHDSFWPASNNRNQVSAARADLSHTLGGPVNIWEPDDHDTDAFLHSDTIGEYDGHNQPGDC